MKSIGELLAHGTIRRRLEENKQRRDAAADEINAAREELAALLLRGRELDPPLTVTEMCEIADVTRERGHGILRGDDPRPRLYESEGSQ